MRGFDSLEQTLLDVIGWIEREQQETSPPDVSPLEHYKKINDVRHCQADRELVEAHRSFRTSQSDADGTESSVVLCKTCQQPSPCSVLLNRARAYSIGTTHEIKHSVIFAARETGRVYGLVEISHAWNGFSLKMSLPMYGRWLLALVEVGMAAADVAQLAEMASYDPEEPDVVFFAGWKVVGK